MGCGLGYWGKLLLQEVLLSHARSNVRLCTSCFIAFLPQGVDWVGLDINALNNERNPGLSPWTRVIPGGPGKIRLYSRCKNKSKIKGLGKGEKKNSSRAGALRTLLLCYPDDFEDGDDSLAYDCIREYKVLLHAAVCTLFDKLLLLTLLFLLLAPG